ncbi:MAG TPA: hypothetical protein VLZ50_02630, partial [Terracidiphilus sp.]|nr:hypothetical protein [Terracidiphilus sp.]
MQKHRSGRRVSVEAECASSRRVLIRSTLARKACVALSLVAICPVALFAGDNRAASAATSVSLSTLFFDFGNNLVGNKLIQTAVAVTNTGKVALAMHPTIAGNASYSIVAKDSCGASLAAGKSCDMVLRYVPTKPSYPRSQDAMLHMNFANADSGVPQ